MGVVAVCMAVSAMYLCVYVLYCFARFIVWLDKRGGV